MHSQRTYFTLILILQVVLSHAYFWNSFRDDRLDPITNMTGTQKSCLKNTWKFLMRNPNKYGPLIFQKFFTKHPEYLPNFYLKNIPTSEFEKDKKFVVYTNMFMYILDSAIDNLKERPYMTKEILKEVALNRSKTNFESRSFWDLRDTVLELISPYVNKKTYEAWDKFLNFTIHEMILGLNESKEAINAEIHNQVHDN